MVQPIHPHERDPVPTVHETGWAPGPVWTGVESIATTGIRSPNHPARSSVAIPTELSWPITEYCIKPVRVFRFTQRCRWGFLLDRDATLYRLPPERNPRLFLCEHLKTSRLHTQKIRLVLSDENLTPPWPSSTLARVLVNPH